MNHSDKVAADKSALGFEFQDLVFVEKLIRLSPVQTLGLEKFDDIHVATATEDGDIEDLVLIQVKHSVDPGNVTDRDIDLWKTLANWLSIIPGLPSHRKLTLQLYTNKTPNDQPFVSLLKAPRKNLQAILQSVRDTHKAVDAAETAKKPGDAANPIAKHVRIVAMATDEALKHLFENFEFHSDNTSVLQRIADRLREVAIPTSCLIDARQHVIGAFKESKFSIIVQGQKVVIGFDDFHKTMGFDRIVSTSRAETADFARFVDIYYDFQRDDTLSFNDSRFRAQLEDIGVGNEEIIDRGVEMMLSERFMEDLRLAGTFTSTQNKSLENEAVSKWKLLHNQAHRGKNYGDGDDESHKAVSLGCYEKTIQTDLTAESVRLPTNLSCGKYMKLSNQPRIGWRKDWLNKFDQ
ncbi:hypothetical protein [Achromobacter sp. JUb104]|uniref:hypothetical protein n=1 Tax=Achromobacter sp. JUb104 TaxID=2940590 RepID=UPI00216AB103|nr:hypothetical protein [Achromobacter sp. JUb104]MCS3505414.1 hypothetical protein [Achromobacter sp. JUb104]